MPSHERALRLRWLLNALEEQTLDRGRWEVVVVHDSRGEQTQRTLEEHPLTQAGMLRHRRLEPGTGTAPRQRNVGWRMARAARVAFTDDDCRPEPGWLEALLAKSNECPDAIVQGAVRPDPFEEEIARAAHVRTLEVEPPGPFAQTANILYPRAVLESAEGFDEDMATSGEDTDLALRARGAGVPYLGAPDALVYHAVEAYPLWKYLTMTWKWRNLPRVVKRHPGLRDQYTLGIFWRPAHLKLVVALLGMPLARRHPLSAAASAAPYALGLLGRRGTHARGRARAMVEAPGSMAVDATELLALAWGSLRYRTLFL